jgi:hypothetical protein
VGSTWPIASADLTEMQAPHSGPCSNRTFARTTLLSGLDSGTGIGSEGSAIASLRSIGKSPRTNSGEPSIYRIAQPALHDLAIGQLDAQRGLEPRHAPGETEIVEWRRSALAPTFEQLLGGPHPEAPLDGAAKNQPPADALSDKDAGERSMSSEEHNRARVASSPHRQQPPAEGEGTVGRHATQRGQQPNDLNPHGRV